MRARASARRHLPAQLRQAEAAPLDAGEAVKYVDGAAAFLAAIEEMIAPGDPQSAD